MSPLKLFEQPRPLSFKTTRLLVWCLVYDIELPVITHHNTGRLIRCVATFLGTFSAELALGQAAFPFRLSSTAEVGAVISLLAAGRTVNLVSLFTGIRAVKRRSLVR